MKRNVQGFFPFLLGSLILLFSTALCFGQTELPALDFVGAGDYRPESQTVTLRVPADSSVEVSDERLVKAVLNEAGERASELTVSVNTDGLEASEEGTEYEARVIVGGIYFIPIRFIFFPRVPRECYKKPRLSTQLLTRGTIDNFVGIEATAPSPYLVSTGLLQRRYDDLGWNKQLFGDSYALGGCRVCAIQIWVRAKREGESDGNDTLGFNISDAVAPYNAVGVGTYFSPMWSGVGSPRTFFTEVPGSVANPEITGKITPMLDIVSQDDTAIDYTRVVVWRY